MRAKEDFTLQIDYQFFSKVVQNISLSRSWLEKDTMEWNLIFELSYEQREVNRKIVSKQESSDC